MQRLWLVAQQLPLQCNLSKPHSRHRACRGVSMLCALRHMKTCRAASQCMAKLSRGDRKKSFACLWLQWRQSLKVCCIGDLHRRMRHARRRQQLLAEQRQWRRSHAGGV